MTRVRWKCGWRSWIHTKTRQESQVIKVTDTGVVALVFVTPFLSVRESRMFSVTFAGWTFCVLLCCCLPLSFSVLRGYVWGKKTVKPLWWLIQKKARVLSGNVQRLLSKFTFWTIDTICPGNHCSPISLLKVNFNSFDNRSEVKGWPAWPLPAPDLMLS